MQFLAALERLRQRIVAFGKRPIAAATRFWSRDRPWIVVIILSFVLLVVSQSVEMVKSNPLATAVFLGMIIIFLAVVAAAWRLAPSMPPGGESAIPAPNPPATREGASNAP